jgi:hypothetical protein
MISATSKGQTGSKWVKQSRQTRRSRTWKVGRQPDAGAGPATVRSSWTVASRCRRGSMGCPLLNWRRMGDSNPHGFPQHPLKKRLFARGLQSVRFPGKNFLVPSV